MTDAEKHIVRETVAEAWDDGFNLCREAAAAICAAYGRPDIATQIMAIPLHKPETAELDAGTPRA